MSFLKKIIKGLGIGTSNKTEDIDIPNKSESNKMDVDNTETNEPESIAPTARVQLLVLDHTTHKGKEYRKLVFDGFMEISDWMTYFFDANGNSMYDNPEDSDKFSSQAFDECMAKRFTDDNYAYVSGGRGQGYMLYKGKAIEEILELTGLKDGYTWKPRTQ
jgi:hypothetical protein